MKIFLINAGFFKLDGGAMFSYIPKTLWKEWNPPDEDNLCTWALRLMLVEHGDMLLLVDTGLFHTDDPRFHRYYKPVYHDVPALLQKAGYSPDDITHVLLTHLHFDHCGGSIVNGSVLFPRATFYVSRRQYLNAVSPNPKEKGSFIKETFLLLEKEHRLHFVEGFTFLPDFFPDIDLFMFDGHTTGMLSPLVKAATKYFFYPTDLIPSSFHLPPHYHMSYDVRPLALIEDKSHILKRAREEKWIVVFEHDPGVWASCVEWNGKNYAPVEKIPQQEEQVVRIL